MIPKLLQTIDYGLFKLNKLNREFHEDKILEASMQKYGFLPSNPIQVRRIPNSEKLEIIRGHHRFRYAKKLKLPIWYVIDEAEVDIYELEAGKIQWNLKDYVFARAQAGDDDCHEVLEFVEDHKISLGAAVSLLGGESPASTNRRSTIKKGTFHIGSKTHANEVVLITDICIKEKIPFGTSYGFVAALSFALRVPKFNRDRFIHKIKLLPGLMKKRSTTTEYLEEIDKLYNHGSSKNRISVAFEAKELSKQRQRNFGKYNRSADVAAQGGC